MSGDLKEDVFDEGRSKLDQAIHRHIGDLARCRANTDECKATVAMLRSRLEEAERILALQELNELLNDVREQVRLRDPNDTSLVLKGPVMKKATDAGLDLATASSLYKQAIADGEAAALTYRAKTAD